MNDQFKILTGSEKEVEQQLNELHAKGNLVINGFSTNEDSVTAVVQVFEIEKQKCEGYACASNEDPMTCPVRKPFVGCMGCEQFEEVYPENK